MKRRLLSACVRPEFWMLLLLVWLSASAFHSIHTAWVRSALTEWLRWGAGLGLALAAGKWLTKARLAAQAITICVGLIAVFGVWDGLTVAHGGMVGPFRDHQLCGSVLLVLLPFTLGAALSARTPGWKWGAQGIFVAGVVCLVMTQTRSAWIGASLMGITFAGLWWYRNRSTDAPPQAKQILVPALLIVGIALSFLTFVGPTELQRSLSARADTLSSLAQDQSWQLRLSAWHGAERMIRDRPFAGWGLGRYPDQQWQFTHRGRILAPSERPSLSEQTHSLYLQTAAEVGLIGVLLFTAILVAFVGQIIAALRRMRGQPIRSRDAFLVATLAFITGFTVDALASPSYQFAEVSLFVWAALGIGLAALNGREQPEAQTIRVPAPLLRLSRLATSGVLSLLLLSQFVPLGLLCPVAAYTAAGYTYQANNPPAITPTVVSAAPGDMIPFTMTAHYTNNSTGATENVDVTMDSTTVFSALSGGFTVSGFGAGGTAKNIFTVPATQANGQPWTNGAQITITGYFFDSALPLVKRNATPALLTVRVSSP